MDATLSNHREKAGSRGAPALTRDEAVARMLAAVTPVAGTEVLALGDALGRVLARPLVSDIDLPPWDNSAMDGYAVRWADIADGGRLPVTQRVAAGRVGIALAAGTAARIFTGAPVPPGADTVVVQEDCTPIGDHVEFPAACAPGANIRRAGEAISAGTEALPAGIRLAPQQIGVAASLGAAALTVHRRLRVAIMSTGDELVPPGRPLGPGQIYNCNRFTLTGLLQGFGCEVVDIGTIPDSAAATAEALAEGAQAADLVLSTGGVSVGDEDHVTSALRRIGALEFNKVAVRPGKAVAFGRIGQTPFFGAPGNPVGLFVAFCLFARPLVLRMQGVRGDLAPGSFKVCAGFDRPRPGKRTEYLRARLRTRTDGATELAIYPKGSSAILSSVAWSDGLAELPGARAVRRGDPVDFLPLSNLLS